MIRRLPSFFANTRETPTEVDDIVTGPPPPYTSSSPFLLTETRTTRTQVTTTTTETTTETKTHVFPNIDDLAATSRRPSPSTRQVTYHGGGSPGPLSIDKALPPTPRSASLASDSPRPSTSSRKSATHPPLSISQLGRASLAVCLPPVAGSDLLSQPIVSAGGTVSFPLISPVAEKQVDPPLRRHKSSQRLQQLDPSSPTRDNPRRRSRGLSLGAVSWLGLGVSTDSKGKGKEKEKAKDKYSDTSTPSRIASVSTNSPPQPLSRRPSFWSRRKTPESLIPHEQPDSSHPLPPPPQVPSLPPIARLSDLDLHHSYESPSHPLTRHSPRPSVARRHSDNPPLTPDRTEFPTTEPEPIARASSSYQPLNSSSVERTEPAPSPRPRAQTNPALLRRLSTALFSLSDTSSAHASPKHSISSCASPLVLTRDIPRPSEDTESPDVYVSRLRAVVSKAEIAVILASSSDLFYVDALNCFFLRFDFHDEPLDIALRKLLMDVGLPRETQQIDRVMEAFSSRYTDCNPSLFASRDNGYLLAFSLIMLHTDAFNPSNKSKMSKADYIKNTSSVGLPAEVLGCFYDNIVFAPFIFIEDPLDINGQVGISSESPFHQLRSPSSSNLLNKPKIDPYYLITNNLLEHMRREVEDCVPLDEPYRYDAGTHLWSDEELQKAFSSAGVIEVEASGGRPSNYANPADHANEVAPLPSSPSSMTIRVTKVGLLNRKDDVGLRGKRNTFRKWRIWSVLLTGSQLLFFRDASIAETVLQSLSAPSDGSDSIASLARPDEILSVKDSVAVFDRNYTKHDHTLRFVMSNGRQILLQATTSEDVDEWLTKINYASAFKSAGVRVRPPGMSQDEMQMTGVAAATSLLHDVQLNVGLPSPSAHPWDSSHSHELMGMLSANSFTHGLSTPRHRLTIMPSIDFDVDTMSYDTATSQQFESTFKKVKAELASDGSYMEEDYFALPKTPLSASSVSSRRLTRSRAGVILQKIDELQSKLDSTRSELDQDLRMVRNIAILKPFQRATRARLLHPVQHVARKIMLLRLEVMRLECHLSVLQRDLESEDRSLHQMQSVALEAAKQSLDRRSDRIPRMTISRPGTGEAADMLPSKAFSRSWSNSSTSESFRSALEYPEELDASLALTPSELFDPPSSNLSPCSTPYPASNESRSSVLERSASYSSSTGGSHKESTRTVDELTEVAEPWNKTRCAQRVSLIRVPSTISFAHPRTDGNNTPFII